MSRMSPWMCLMFPRMSPCKSYMSPRISWMSAHLFMMVHFQFQRHISGSDATLLVLVAHFGSRALPTVWAPRFPWGGNNSSDVMGERGGHFQ
jgi:hypothetical protein